MPTLLERYMHSSNSTSSIQTYQQYKPHFPVQRSLPISINNHIYHHGPREIKHIFLEHLVPRPNVYPRDCRLHGPPPPDLCRVHAFARRARQRPAASLRRFVLLRRQLELYLDSAEHRRREFDPNERPGNLPSATDGWPEYSKSNQRPLRLSGQLDGSKSPDFEQRRGK